MAFVRNPNQQDLSWFLDMDKQERLELTPSYQRRSVWTYRDKQDFLDTILNNYPCPAIYLQKENTASGPKYNVVDGKQRLSTVLNFYAGKTRLSKKFAIAALRGKKFQDLSEDYKSAFYNYIFVVEQIRSDNDGEVDWGEVFQRVNKNQKTLKEQELRHAKYDGWLINRAEAEAGNNDLWKTIGVSSSSRKSRMKDVEFVSILMLCVLENQFVGFPQWKIDELYAKYDFDFDEIPEDEASLNFDTEEEGVEEDVEEFNTITQEQITEFESTFKEIRDFVEDMEKHNACITSHKKRLFTDLYSLWCALAFDPNILPLGHEKIANKYSEFISTIDGIYVKTKNGDTIEEFSKGAQVYFGSSTGAATEEEPRKQRHTSLTEFFLQADNED